MALINCPSCKNDVSDQAANCPKCGHPIADKEQQAQDTQSIKNKRRNNIYEYKMVQASPVIQTGKVDQGHEAATYLQQIVDEQTQDGWEFYRVDSLGVLTNPGCLRFLTGKKIELTYYNVISFRRKK